MSLGNHIVVLNNGRVEQFGTKEDLFRRPKNTFVAQIIGDPPMNLMKGKIVKVGGKSIFQSGGVKLDLKEAVKQGSVTLGIRSSRIHLASASGNGTIDAEVYSCGKHRMNTVVSMKIGKDIFKTEFRGHRSFEIGQRIAIQFDLSDICIFDGNEELIQVLGERHA